MRDNSQFYKDMVDQYHELLKEYDKKLKAEQETISKLEQELAHQHERFFGRIDT